MKSTLLAGMGWLMLSFTLIFAGCGGKNTSGSAASATKSTGDLANAAQTVSSTAKSSGGGKSSGKEAPASDFSYDLTENGKGIMIKGYTGKGGAVVIPAMIEDMLVVAISNSAFKGGSTTYGYKDQKPSDAITSLVLPASVVTIGNSAFAHMENLTSITLPEGLKEILDWTFIDCEKLTKVNLPASLEKIDSNAFRDCRELKDLMIPASLTGVTFWDKSGFVDKEDPNNYAFSGCGKLPIKTQKTLQGWGYKGSF